MRTVLLTCLTAVFLFGLTGTSAGQVKKKQEEPIKDKKLAGIVKDLKHKDAKTRVAAMKDLLEMAQVRPSDAAPAISYVFPMLKDLDASVRRTAILTLEALDADSKQFVPPLVDILKKDKDPAVRLAAVTAVGNIGPPASAAAPALEAIQRSIKDNPKEKVLAAEVSTALRRIKKK
jgi:HEAT repeat protein